jgi:hypothetical protein
MAPPRGTPEEFALAAQRARFAIACPYTGGWGHPAAEPFTPALVEDGVPSTSSGVDDVHREDDRRIAPGLRFAQPPTETGPVTTAALDDTCGTLIGIVTEKQHVRPACIPPPTALRSVLAPRAPQDR